MNFWILKILANQNKNRVSAAVRKLLYSDPPVDHYHQIFSEHWTKVEVKESDLRMFLKNIKEFTKRDPEFAKYFVRNLKKYRPAKAFQIFIEYSKLALFSDVYKNVINVYGSARTTSKDGAYIGTREIVRFLYFYFKENKNIEAAFSTGGAQGIWTQLILKHLF